jgi:DNA primase
VPDGSLVQHLQRDGYTPRKLVDSGLVSVKKKKREELIQLQTSNLVAEPVGKEVQDPVVTATSFAFEYHDLMDRFMNRLMVPIWDAEGMHVIGFGGRIIDVPVNVNTAAAAATNFTAPKYINSPESAIFHKKENLCGPHEAAKALSQKHALSNNNTVVIVEGYMDYLSLSNFGIDNVAATMGTALSGQQLQLAGAAATPNQTRSGKFIHARAVHTGYRVRKKVSLLADQNLILSCLCLFLFNTFKGEIILLMDNDTSGVAAIERLCTSQITHGVVEENPILAVSVASLPQGVKDPDEYVMTQLEENDDDEQLVAQKFHEDVTSTACDWKMWYLRRLSTDRERNTAIDATGEKKGMGSNTDGGTMLLLLPLPEICNKASDFLLTPPLEKDRSQMSSDFAAWLTAARKVTADASSESASDNSPSSDDEAARFYHKASAIRLETDLFSLSNKKARMKEFKASQRAKHSEGEDDQNYFGPWPEAARKKTKQMGKGAKSEDDDYYGP